jgi:hypothetical protein
MGGSAIAPPFLMSALDAGELLASRPGRYTSGERPPSTHWIGGCLGPTASLDAVEKRKVPASAGNGTPTVQPVAHRYTD